MPVRPGRSSIRTALLLVAIAAVAYTAFFSWLAIGRHDAFLTHTADLGQIDLAVWNTAHGRFVQEVKGEGISTRLTDHFEPIFWPVSLLFHVWDDVRVLLIAQAAALALAALPVLAFVALADRPAPRDRRLYALAGLWAALAYLLAPQAQAANVADFHAAPLAALPLALLLYLGTRRLLWPALAVALIGLAVKEEMALMVAAAGLYLALARRWRPGWLLLALASLWFVAVTFALIPRYAEVAYGEARSPYLARYDDTGADGSSHTASPLARAASLARRSLEPERLGYLGGLLLAFAGMPLLAPEVALVALPLIGANFVSNYDAMYGGEFHYSAPFMAVLACAAGVGARRLFLFARRRAPRATAPLLALLLAAPLAYQAWAGFTPMGRQFWLHRPATTPHHALLQRFAALIPAQACLSTTPPLHPHFSHRQRIYTFPDLAQAEYVLLDVSGTTDMHPNDFRRAYDDLLASGYGIVDSADGYVLLRGGHPSAGLSREFAGFAVPATGPRYRVDADFGASLRLLGYDLLDERKWRLTRLRLHWQVLAPLGDDTAPYVLFTASDGTPLVDTRGLPFIEPLWLRASQWQPGDVFTTTTVARRFEAPFTAHVAVVVGDDPANVAARLPVSQPAAPGSRALVALNCLRLPPIGRVPDAIAPRLAQLPPLAPPADATRLQAVFAGSLALEAAALPPVAEAGEELAVTLYWQRRGPAPEALSLSLRLLDAAGNVVAGADGPPHHGLYPVADWADGETVTDGRSLPVPSHIAAGVYSLSLVAYDWTTLRPYELVGGGAALHLGYVEVR